MKRILTLLLSLLLLAGAVLAAGDTNDPAITRSFVEQVYTPELKEAISRHIHGGLGAAGRDNVRTLADDRAKARLRAQKAAEGVARKAAGSVVCKQNDVLTLLPGCRVSVKYGTVSPEEGPLSDVTRGLAAGTEPLSPGTLYMAGGECRLQVRTATCELTLSGVYRRSPSEAPDYGSMADALNAMGLFQGGGPRVGYNLEAGASRAEGLVMFLRILGLEDEALAYEGECPFDDVPAGHWAGRYVAYAYSKGLTSGTGPNRFSPAAPITCQQYVTFLLRALHYKEEEDFTYKTVLSDYSNLGMATQKETDSLSAGSFRRYQMVYLSYYALFGADQTTGRLLMSGLTGSGTVESESLSRGLSLVVGGPIQ